MKRMYNESNDVYDVRRGGMCGDVYSTIYIPAATAAWAERSIPVTLLLASSLSRGLNWSVEFSY